MRFDNKVVLVTGAGRGMGRAIALAYAREGARVVVSARTPRHGEETIAQITALGGEAHLVGGDIADRAAVGAMVDGAIEAFGALDILVHCAADTASGLIAEMADETFDHLVRSNIQSLFWLAKDAAPHLSKAQDKGRIIFISSGEANRKYTPTLIPYSSSKAFMNAFARGLAVEFGALNILVNVIEPGLIGTDHMLETLGEELPHRLAERFPVPRLGQSADIAAAALFLTSSEASYITGTSLLVDGGATMVAMPRVEEILKGIEPDPYGPTDTAGRDRSLHMSDTSIPPQRAAIDLTEFKRGWRILLLGLVGICTSISAGLLYGFGTLVIPLEQAFGWSRGELQASITFLFAGVAISTQLVGPLYRRFGLRRVAIVSIVLQVIGYAAITRIEHSIGWLYLAFFAMPLVCAGTIAITWTQLVNLWFERNRGLALAVILCGTGLMAVLLPPLLARLIAQFGWQAGFFTLAALPLLFTLPMALLWMRLPGELEPALPGGSETVARLDGLSFSQALRSPVYWSFNVALILSVCLTVGMVTNMVPMLQGKGLSAQVASQVFSSFGISIIAGRLLVGYLLDRYPPILVAVISLALPAIGCAIFLFGGVQSIALLVLATLCIGASAGAEFDLAAFLMARYFGLREYARIFGLHLALITIVSGLMPVFFGYLYEAYDGYSAVLLCCLACSIIGPSILLWLRPAAVVTVQQQHA